jgi:hypothetical protein
LGHIAQLNENAHFSNLALRVLSRQMGEVGHFFPTACLGHSEICADEATGFETGSASLCGCGWRHGAL